MTALAAKAARPSLDLAAIFQSALTRDADTSRFWRFFITSCRDERGLPFSEGPLFELVADYYQWLYEQARHGSFVASPGIGKTVLANSFQAWCIGRKPTMTTACISAGKDRAESNVSYMRAAVLTDRFKAAFPAFKPDTVRSKDQRGWRKEEFFADLGPGADQPTPTAIAAAAAPRNEGWRFHLVVADDMNTSRIAASAAMRAEMQNALENTWLHRIKNGRGMGKDGNVIVIQNCWRKADMGHYLRGRSDFVSLWLGVNDDCASRFALVFNAPSDFPLFANPERYGAEYRGERVVDGRACHEWKLPLAAGETQARLLADQAANPQTFARAYRLKAPDATDLMFAGWRNAETPKTAAAALGLRVDSHGVPIVSPDQAHTLAFVAGVDVSGSGRSGSSIVVVAVDLKRKKYPIYASRFAGGYLEIIARLDALERNGFDFALVNFESNAIQDQLRQATVQLKRQQNDGAKWPGRVKAFITGANKANPDLGLPGLATELQTSKETGAIQWPAAQRSEKNEQGREFAALESSLDDCPISIPRGETSDNLMAFWFAWHGAGQVVPSAHGGNFAPRGVRPANPARQDGVRF